MHLPRRSLAPHSMNRRAANRPELGRGQGRKKRTATVATSEPSDSVVYETHLKLIRGNVASGSAEPERRAIEHAVFAYRRDYPNASLEAARAAVLAAINRSSMRKAPSP